MTLIDGPRLPPLSGGPAKSLVIMLHGYGADGHDLIDLGKIWQTNLIDTAFISPHAPEICDLSAFGKQWFSLQQYDPELLRRDPNHLAEAFEKLIPGARSAQNILEEFIHHELEALDLGWENLALVGFSQGTMLSLFAGLRQKMPPAGILGYSGALVGASILEKEIICTPPIILLHGEEDDILPFPSMELARQGLKQAGVPITTHSCPGLGHSIDMEGIIKGGEFLSTLI